MEDKINTTQYRQGNEKVTGILKDIIVVTRFMIGTVSLSILKM
ncbi:hypothetical protein SC1083_1992 [Aggregatibacter actinomycetemcomitans serotype e str. SC1083]|uniref:Uncharacterized protein n=1 Tax=Aggregatibacter actinomycetemcomitans serotype e str. SC1083 TaxID=907488 RepID=G4AAW2_AGGAC|nr:hypothetical protein SC1083_1992 [Aggregatibacter actinomycetemcomitans serotype e str. SC1083]KYK75335.1 hypothetical protein SA3096_03410 [Aggregatibacter actinomycetemcomitans serotype e str. SA3096]KYK77510.1 hypothetical protein SC936_11025 [Aggregatibacter actinomycetemcomitans serotype e str. SC936]